MIGKVRRVSLLVIGTLLFVMAGSATQSEAMGRVDVGVSLPAHRFASPPHVAVIPGTYYVYMVPDTNVDVLFYQGYWWRPYQSRWYRSQNYNGRWNYIETRNIPRGLRELPRDYRNRLSPRYERIPHKDMERNWKTWEQEKYWDRRGQQGRGGYGEQGRGGPSEQKGRRY